MKVRGTPKRTFQKDPFGFGLICTFDPILALSANTINIANDCYFHRIIGGGEISKIGVGVSVQSGNISVAVYRNSGSGRSATPGTRLATSGNIGCPAVGYTEISLGTSIQVNPGDWFSLSCDNTTATFLRIGTLGGGIGGTNMFAGRSWVQSPGHPSPVVPSGAPSASRSFLIVGVP